MEHRQRKFTCYFCQKTIENETEMGHTTVCSKVLVPCPNKCGSYIPRASMPKHELECVNQRTKSPATISNNLPKMIREQLPNPGNSYSLDRSKSSTKPQLQEQIVTLQRKLSNLESRQNTTENYNAPSRLEELKHGLNQNKLSVEKINYFNGILSEWKRNLENQIESLKMSTMSLDILTKESNLRWQQIQERLMHLEKLHMDFHLVTESLYKDNTHFKNSEMDFARNIEDLKLTLDQQNTSISSFWDEHQQSIATVMKNMEEISKTLDEQRAKHTSAIFDLRAVSQIASEAAEKIEIQERDFGELRKEVNQMKVDLEILETLACSNETMSVGSVLWKITEVGSKLKRAKENGIVLKSPILYTHQYGYKIRLLLYLNGLKKWRDRYALACIHVLKGEYDMLLNWPCNIEGNVIVRDLENPSKPKPFSKFIKAKRSCGDEESEEPQESSSTYIFIPHNVLLKETYLKNDTLFVELKIQSPSNKYETTL